MFGTIRKHSTWLWVLIIIFVSISMVVFFSSDVSLTGPGSGGPAGDFGSIDGKPITREQYFDASQETRLQHFLSTRTWPGTDEASMRRLEVETISRVYLVHKLKEMDIHPSQKAIGMMVQSQLGEMSYDTLEKEILAPNRLSLVDYERFVRNEVGRMQLASSVGISARLVTSKEAEVLWKKENQEVDTKVAVFSASNYLDKVVITNGALGAFYTNRMGLYRLPERTVISYVAFAASNYLAEADQTMAQRTNITEVVNEYYFRGGTNVWKDTNGVPLPELEAKQKIREEIRLDFARVAARRAAAEFGNDLISQPEPNKVANFDKLAAAKGLAVRTTAPFDRMAGLEEFAGETNALSRTEEEQEQSFSQILREKALALTDEKPILFNPIPGYNAVYVIARKSRIPSELQSFETVQEKLKTDYKNFMAQDMARKAGQAFHTNLTNGLTLKKGFDEIAAAEKVRVIDVPPFAATTKTLTNLDAGINLQMLQRFVGDLEVGEASPFIPQMDGGLIVYVSARPPVDPAKMASELDDFVGTMRIYRHNEAFNRWFRHQAEIDRLTFPKREQAVSSAANN